MSAAVRALLGALGMVLGAPVLLIGVTLITLAAALPFGVVLGDRLRTALSNQPPISLDATEIDAEWWMEFRAHAEGLEATFTPTVLGFAAPLDNLSALLDATPRPIVLAAPIALFGLAWAFLSGGLLHRFAERRPIGARAFVRAAMRCLPRFLAIAAGAALASWLLYSTVHAVLFGPVYDWLAATAANERDVFFGRVALYLIFGACLAAVSLIADYARVTLAVGAATTLSGAVAAALTFIRAHARAVVVLYLLTGSLFVGLLVTYGLVDRRLGGWRAVLVGQAYIVARLAIRLTFAASEVRLFQTVRAEPEPVRD